MAGPVARSAYLGWLWRAWAQGGATTPAKGDAVLGLATGYDAHVVPRRFAQTLRCEKPVDPSRMVEALRARVAAAAG